MKPSNKVAAGALAGGVVAVLAWVLKEFTKVELSPDAAVGLSVIVTFFTQYLVRDVDPLEPQRDDE